MQETKGYGQFCPVAKAAEIFATRWTPLVLRELMVAGSSFNDIHRGVPLMSRALLADRLKHLEYEGIVEKRLSKSRGRVEYWLTPAGDAFGGVIEGLARWGISYARDRLEPRDLNPGLFMWMLRSRARLEKLPRRKFVLQFDFSGIPSNRTKLQRMWLVLEPNEVDVCMKDPGFGVDLSFQGDIKAFVAVFLRQVEWREVLGKAILFEGREADAKRMPVWFNI